MITINDNELPDDRPVFNSFDDLLNAQKTYNLLLEDAEGKLCFMPNGFGNPNETTMIFIEPPKYLGEGGANLLRNNQREDVAITRSIKWPCRPARKSVSFTITGEY